MRLLWHCSAGPGGHLAPQARNVGGLLPVQILHGAALVASAVCWRHRRDPPAQHRRADLRHRRFPAGLRDGGCLRGKAHLFHDAVAHALQEGCGAVPDPEAVPPQERDLRHPDDACDAQRPARPGRDAALHGGVSGRVAEHHLGAPPRGAALRTLLAGAGSTPVLPLLHRCLPAGHEEGVPQGHVAAPGVQRRHCVHAGRGSIATKDDRCVQR
mmetsp:Transcript_30765/g.84851  ORF Transcript_30765/g.84851 Transcript_30765/m.84851 type:complete len:213 (+) Transcript_30765:1466-2104(+)